MGHCWAKSSTRNVEDHYSAAELAPGNVELISTISKWEEKISDASKDGRIVVVNFSASWCSPCRLIAPAYSELADKYPSMVFLTVDVDELAEFSTSWDITATPTFFFMKNGQQLDKLIGANKAELQRKIMDIAESTTKLRD